MGSTYYMNLSSARSLTNDEQVFRRLLKNHAMFSSKLISDQVEASLKVLDRNVSPFWRRKLADRNRAELLLTNKNYSSLTQI